MDVISNVASGFIGLFQAGGEQFMGWVTGIIPLVVCLMTAVNSIIKIAEDYQVHGASVYTASFDCSILPGKSGMLYIRTFSG